MDIPTIVVNGVNYGEPTSPFVVVWSGPVDATEFNTLGEARTAIRNRRADGDANAFQPRIYTLSEKKTEWALLE
jgi:hypothetical protein